MKSCHKTFFTIPLSHNCITDGITLSGFNSLPAAYVFETKTPAFVRLAVSTHRCRAAHNRWWFLQWREVCSLSLCSKSQGRNQVWKWNPSLEMLHVSPVLILQFNPSNMATRGRGGENDYFYCEVTTIMAEITPCISFDRLTETTPNRGISF